MATRGPFQLSYESLNTIFLTWDVRKGAREDRPTWSHHMSYSILSYHIHLSMAMHGQLSVFWGPVGIMIHAAKACYFYWVLLPAPCPQVLQKNTGKLSLKQIKRLLSPAGSTPSPGLHKLSAGCSRGSKMLLVALHSLSYFAQRGSRTGSITLMKVIRVLLLKLFCFVYNWWQKSRSPGFTPSFQCRITEYFLFLELLSIHSQSKP